MVRSVTLTYVDVGLSGENDVDGDKADIETTFSISNFGAIVELDKALYNWTDTVYITITAPDHNNNSCSRRNNRYSSTSNSGNNPKLERCVQVQAATGTLYAVAAETGPDTGVFDNGSCALEGYASINCSQQFPKLWKFRHCNL